MLTFIVLPWGHPVLTTAFSYHRLLKIFKKNFYLSLYNKRSGNTFSSKKIPVRVLGKSWKTTHRKNEPTCVWFNFPAIFSARAASAAAEHSVLLLYPFQLLSQGAHIGQTFTQILHSVHVSESIVTTSSIMLMAIAGQRSIQPPHLTHFSVLMVIIGPLIWRLCKKPTCCVALRL